MTFFTIGLLSLCDHDEVFGVVAFAPLMIQREAINRIEIIIFFMKKKMIRKVCF